MHCRYILFTLLLWTQTTIAYGQVDTSRSGNYDFNLANCIQYGLAHQNDVVNARLDVNFSQEQIKEYTGKFLPHVNVNGSLTDNLKLQTSLIPDIANGNYDKKIPVQFGTKWASAATGQVDQVIFNSDYFLGLKASRVYGDLSKKTLKRTEIDTRVAITKAYYAALAAEENIRLAKSNMTQLSKTLSDTKARYDVGVAERVDVDRIQVSYNNVVTDIETQIRDLVYAMQLLKFQMGMPQDNKLTLTETVQDLNADVFIADTVDYQVQDRIEYSIQTTQIALDELSLKSKKLGILPQLNAYVNYGFNYFSTKFGDLYKTGYGASALGLTLKWPIFAGTERYHQIQENRITLEKSRNTLRYIGDQIQLDVANANTQYQNNKARYVTQKTNMDLTQGIYDRIVLKFEQGVATSLDVTSAENDLKQAQVNYVQALLNTLTSKTDLDKAMGKIK
ncbi:outer membrane protein TolC [Chitinophaga polysaccharea]|uniref:Outer membrane protein TolC n=1 Tax=Chitinophaga polysaccharea TaxID=1293035 RepID=A0A561PNI1_9BACT|nr:TolC family protein [Chitinophaga polysaccharea]TWF39676.1 outer membrane protein TolC [Chitinophaga polysaccharea]